MSIGLTALLAHKDVDAWWLLPVAVAFLLAESLRRGVRSRSGLLPRVEVVNDRRRPGESNAAGGSYRGCRSCAAARGAAQPS